MLIQTCAVSEKYLGIVLVQKSADGWRFWEMENFKIVLENYDTTTPWKKERVRMTPVKTK